MSKRSWLYSPTLNTGESNILSGGTIAGTESYSRTTNFMSGLNATDTIAIELHAGRSWGGSGCVERITIKLITKHGWLLLIMELFQLVLSKFFKFN